MKALFSALLMVRINWGIKLPKTRVDAYFERALLKDQRELGVLQNSRTPNAFVESFCRISSNYAPEKHKFTASFFLGTFSVLTEIVLDITSAKTERQLRPLRGMRVFVMLQLKSSHTHRHACIHTHTNCTYAAVNERSISALLLGRQIKSRGAS